MIIGRGMIQRSSLWRVNQNTCVTLHRRLLMTLAIETSCDDTSVAVLEKHQGHYGRIKSNDHPAATIHFHEKITSNNVDFRGIHPLVALHSHQQNLAGLIQRAVKFIPTRHEDQHAPVDFVTVTRGPGMRSNLSVGLDTAKGLAIAWDVPLLAVNHMHAHALTPRLVNALRNSKQRKPAFPFLSLLVSGGHTLLLHSRGLCSHTILAETMDIAIGEAIDKVGRAVIPQEILESSDSTMYGPILEQFVFGDGDAYEYRPPANRTKELESRPTPYGWSLTPPLSKSGSTATSSKTMAYTFTGILTRVLALLEERSGTMRTEQRRHLAKEAMRVMFEHLASRVVLALKAMPRKEAQSMQALVISGGVAANQFLRKV